MAKNLQHSKNKRHNTRSSGRSETRKNKRTRRSYSRGQQQNQAREDRRLNENHPLCKTTDELQLADDVLDRREDRIEGRNPIREALKSGRHIDKVWVQKSDTGYFEQGLYELIRDLKDRGTVVVEVDKHRLDAMAQTFNHQGIIAQVAMQSYVTVKDILARAAAADESPFIFLLDKIQDAYNLGSILRIADACGAHGVVIPERRAVGLNALVAKASVGAVEHVPCARVTNMTQTVLELKDNGVWIAGTDMAGETIYGGVDLTGPLAIVIGNEGEGISPGLLKHCDYLLSIPMLGQINSLNAAVACGVVAYEALRQRQDHSC
ncbi:MAG TPA: 23S rRNA (guanosine(2251)-2'-O)-methyltransferase RlmB [Clostridiaceae bacterium]|nr:23S rRNA (guanosine(2251)-2'-O)-methyltransferase RlmB [Clostridiaceae bacterium]